MADTENVPGPQGSLPLTSLPLSMGQGLSPDQLLRALRSARPKAAPSLPPRETALVLRSRLQTLEVVHEFSKGQLVKWKQGLKNRLLPDSSQPAIVVEVLPQPIIDQAEKSESPYFREPLELVLGVFIPDDAGFAIYYYDKRRFEPFIEPA